MSATPSRRDLRFESLDQVAAEVQRLHHDGYVSVGKWNLGQVAAHLGDWLSYPMDGFPKPLAPIRLMLWILKVTWGKREFKRMLSSGQMKAGNPTMPATVHDPGTDETESIDRLLATIERFKAHPGEFHPSPVFGVLSRDEALQLQLLHASLHLSFLVPRSSATD